MAKARDYQEIVRARRSRRQFLERAIDRDAVERALIAAMRAPSGANRQPWRYVLIERGPIRDKVREACEKADEDFHRRSPDWLKEFYSSHHLTPVKPYLLAAPLLVVVFGRRDLPYWLPSVWLSIGNFLNAIEAEGLQSLPYTPSLSKSFNRMLGVEESWSCQAVLPIGHADPDERLEPRPRKGPAERVQVIDGDGRLGPYKARLPFEP